MQEYYKGKAVSNGCWVYGSLIHIGSYCCILPPEEDIHPMDYPYLNKELGDFDGRAIPVLPETVGIYTNILDKYNNKIFKGDLVKYTVYDLWEVCAVVNIGEYKQSVNGDEYSPLKIHGIHCEVLKTKAFSEDYEGYFPNYLKTDSILEIGQHKIELIGNVHDNNLVNLVKEF
jgi:hypothetical protein